MISVWNIGMMGLEKKKCTGFLLLLNYHYSNIPLFLIY